MQIGFKYHNVRGFGRLYDYTYRDNHIITKEAKQRLKMLRFWRQYGLEATTGAFGTQCSAPFAW